MADDRYRFIDVTPANDDEEVIVINERSLSGEKSGLAANEGSTFADATVPAVGQGDSLQPGAIDSSQVPPVCFDDDASSFSVGNQDDVVSAPVSDDPAQELDPDVPFVNMQRIILVVLALLLVGFLAYFLTGCVKATDTSSASDRATNKVILQYVLDTNKSKTVKSNAYDVTGDGKADTVALKPTIQKDYAGKRHLSELSVLVNKKKALTFTSAERSLLKDATSVTLKFMTLSGGAQFVALTARDDDGEGFSGVYRIKGKKLKPVITSYLDSASVWSPISQMKDYNMSIQAVGNQVEATVDFTCCFTGLTKATFAFEPKDGSLELASDEAVSFSYRSINAHSYDTASLTASRNFTIYRDQDLQSYPFDVSSGDTCEIESVAIKDSRILFKVKDGETSGWIASPSYGSDTYFEETSTTEEGFEEGSDVD